MNSTGDLGSNSASVLKPYPAYKPSGLEWLGEVPEHWRIVRNGQIFVQRNETGFPELPILEVSLSKGVRMRNLKNPNRKQMMTVRSDYKRAAKGDIAYNMMRMWQGAVGVTAVDGLVSPAYVVASPRGGTESRYFSALFRTSAYMAEVDKHSRGIVKDRNRLYWIDFKQMPSPCPPTAEQAAIARYIDRADRQIGRYINAKEKLVELLKEQRQTLVDEAVTGQIDVRTGLPYAAYKPSGVEWLGEVPAHWEVRRLRNAVKMRVSNVDKHVRKGEIPVRLCNYVDVYKHNCISQQIDFMRATATPEEIEQFRLEDGDVLITKDSEAWDDIGVPAIVTEPAEDLISGYHLALLRPFADVLIGSYLLRALQSQALAHQFHVEAKGVTRYGLSHASIKSVWLALPPLPEQVSIARYLGSADRRIRRCIQSAQRQIELLKEYRTRLIADIVTGKLDVSDAVAGLPEAESLDAEYPDTISDEDAAGDAGSLDTAPWAAGAKA